MTTSRLLTSALLLVLVFGPAHKLMAQARASDQVLAASGPSANPLALGRAPIVLRESPKQRDALDVLEKVVQVAAVAIGGIWVWANYLLNRTHRARLEARVHAEVLRSHPGFVKVVLGLKNVGLSRVDILQEGTAVRIFSLDIGQLDDLWKRRATAPIWTSVTWIEPGESCEEQQLLYIPVVLSLPVKLELFIVCRHRTLSFGHRKEQVLRASFVLPAAGPNIEVPS